MRVSSSKLGVNMCKTIAYVLGLMSPAGHDFAAVSRTQILNEIRARSIVIFITHQRVLALAECERRNACEKNYDASRASYSQCVRPSCCNIPRQATHSH